MKEFVVDCILHREDICNLSKTSERLLQGLVSGKNQVFYGRRNTGKTSLIRSLVLPNYLALYPQRIAIFADLLGVRTLGDIADRILIALGQALRQKYPTQSKIKSFVKSFVHLQPTMAIDPVSGDIGLTLTTKNKNPSGLSEVFEELSQLHSKTGVVLALDEFQDIALVNGAEAAMRTCLQQMPRNLPVIALGSKKHMLAQIFAHPTSPLANWGFDVDMPVISTEEYCHYINERLAPHGLSIGTDETLWLQKKMRFVPESMNFVCLSLIDLKGEKGAVKKAQLDLAIKSLLSSRQSRFEEYLLQFTQAEINVLIAMAHHAPVAMPTSMGFLRQCGVSSAGVLKVIGKLENTAVVYRDPSGYDLSDPLLAEYLVHYRVHRAGVR